MQQAILEVNIIICRPTAKFSTDLLYLKPILKHAYNILRFFVDFAAESWLKLRTYFKY